MRALGIDGGLIRAIGWRPMIQERNPRMTTQTPKEQVEVIVGRLEEQGVRALTFEEAIALSRSHPESVADLALAVIERFPKGGTFLDAALSYLPDGLWDGLVHFALNTLEKSGANEAADSVIAYASLQALPALHPHLDHIFRLRPNSKYYYENWPWRESGTIDFETRRRVLEDANATSDLREKAWRALLETRQPRVVSHALALADSDETFARGFTRERATVEDHLHHVGFARIDGRLERICPEALYHIVFPKSFFEGQSRPPWLERIHPTWNLEPESPSPGMPFGGLANGDCSVCGSRLHRLITLESVPEDLGITGLDRVELATCLSCLGWDHGQLFYRHGADGRPESIGYDGPRTQPQFPVGPLREAELRLAETPRRWRWQDWALSNSRENLNRIGGEPCWVQSAEYPECPICEGLMRFLMQLDSDLPAEDGGEWAWGTGGIGYGFWCDRCKVSAFLWQCT